MILYNLQTLPDNQPSIPIHLCSSLTLPPIDNKMCYCKTCFICDSTIFILIYKYIVLPIQPSNENLLGNVYMSVSSHVADLSCHKILQNQNFEKDSWCKINVSYSAAMICLYSLEKRARNLFKTFKTTHLLCWSIKQILTHAASLYQSLMAVVSTHVALPLANGISMGQNLLLDIPGQHQKIIVCIYAADSKKTDAT